MLLKNFIEKIKSGAEISFAETMAVIAENYNYQATSFSNGLAEAVLSNPAGQNEGSCKIFAFAQLNQLTPEQTLSLFGDFYRVDVLQNPAANNHQNIRNFIKYGWEGIHFNAAPLTPKT
ncbi:MAG: HopJ type III effector protein [Methylococcaceae bacterium]|jgi:hypothetical protein